MSDLTWEQFVSEAVKTAPEQSDKLTLAQVAMGLTSEVTEVQHATPDEIDEELSDMWWYLALASDHFVHPHIEGDTPNDWLESNNHFAGTVGAPDPRDVAADLCGFVESSVCQLDDPYIEIKGCLAWLAAWADSQTDTPAPDIWAANVRKLRDRHGSSWSPAGEQER